MLPPLPFFSQGRELHLPCFGRRAETPPWQAPRRASPMALGSLFPGALWSPPSSPGRAHPSSGSPPFRQDQLQLCIPLPMAPLRLPWPPALPASSAPPHSWRPCPSLPGQERLELAPAPTLSRGSSSQRPDFFFQCPVHLPPSSSPCAAPFPPMAVSSPSGRHPPLCSALSVRRQPIYAAMPARSSEPRRSTRPWLPSFPSTSASSSASRQSGQRATTSVSY
uniref:Uncharacterized protein n=1 Tax=Zea mays TaxID=4577 RepID=A0A804R9J9_MAIZE